MNSPAGATLLGDIGGTYARFTLLADGRIGPIEVLAVSDYRQFADAVAAYLARRRDDGISRAVFGAAGPAQNNRCQVTNSGWVIDAAELRRGFAWSDVCIVNDFAAIAWSLPRLAPTDLFAIGDGKAVPRAPAAVLGPGTGLGLACLAPRGERADGAIVMATEGGHATMPATSPREDAVIEHLRTRLGHVSAERVLSGAGLVNLYQAIGSIDQRTTIGRSAAEITAAALDGTCPICHEALDLFCAMLGTFAGDAALTFAARGGVYIAGGIAPRLTSHLRRSQFRPRFEAKGRLQPYLAAIPTWVIIHAEPTFVGLQWLAEHAFKR